MGQCVLMMGTFDSKGNEFAYLYKELLRRNVTVKTMNVGVFEPKGGSPLIFRLARLRFAEEQSWLNCADKQTAEWQCA